MTLAVASAATAQPICVREASARPLVVGRQSARLRDVLQTPALVVVRSSGPTSESAEQAVDGRQETAWTGRAGESVWQLAFSFATPLHLGLLRAHWGESSTSGVPTDFWWESRRPSPEATSCEPTATNDEGSWTLIGGTRQAASPGRDLAAQPTHRSWFVDVTTCGLRLVVNRTNAAPPVLRELRAFESASNVLEGGHASDDGAYDGFQARSAIDGDYGTRWVGASGRSQWMLRVDLPKPQTIDRVRLVLGFDSTSSPRPSSGRSYAMAWAPVHYALEMSDDGRNFVPVAYEPTRTDGTLLPLRRRLVELDEPRRVAALRLIMVGATGASGRIEPGAVPVVREIAAFRADDRKPILSAPWILSVNANPSGQSHFMRGGEIANDAYRAKFLHDRLSALLPALRRDDRFARSLGPRGEWLGAPPNDEAGEALESIEGDDPELDAHLLAESSPPPIVVLSGSNDWDYAVDTGPDTSYPAHWRWDPLREASSGGMGQLAEAVQNRVAPFVGFCGGAQILALLEARRPASTALEDLPTIDRVLQRTSGRPIRGLAPSVDLDRAWPTDPHPSRAKIRFVAADRLFVDLAGPYRRSTTHAMPEWHTDAIRPDAFLPGRPLDRFDLVATSDFCAAGLVRNGSVSLDSSGGTRCAVVPETFRSRDHAWPVIGAQFHAEQGDFVTAAPSDPPESIADPRLFLAAAYEEIVDAYEMFSR